MTVSEASELDLSANYSEHGGGKHMVVQTACNLHVFPCVSPRGILIIFKPTSDLRIIQNRELFKVVNQ